MLPSNQSPMDFSCLALDNISGIFYSFLVIYTYMNQLALIVHTHFLAIKVSKYPVQSKLKP